MKPSRTRNEKSVAELEKQIRSYLESHSEIRELLDLIGMAEADYVRALMAYRVPVMDSPSLGSTRTATKHVNISATDREPITSS